MEKVQTLIKINNQAYSIQISECCESVEIVLTNIVTKTSYCCSLDEPNIRNITLTGGFIRSPRQFSALLKLGAKNAEDTIIGKTELTGKIDSDDNTLLLSLTVKLDMEDMTDSILYVVPMRMVEKKDINRMEEMMLDFCKNYTSNIDEKQIGELKENLRKLTDSKNKDKNELLAEINVLECDVGKLEIQLKSIVDNERELKTLISTLKDELLQKIIDEKNTSTKESNNIKEELKASIKNAETGLTHIVTTYKNESTTGLSDAKAELTQMVTAVKTELAQLVADTKAELVKMINDNKALAVVSS
jgi:hypothetical protein